MPLKKILFPYLDAQCPCVVCLSSRIFEFHPDVIKEIGSSGDYLTMYAVDRVTIIGEARIHCAYLKRSVQHIKYLEHCPFFNDGIDSNTTN